MAHEIATLRGRAAMMYAGDTPWHGLGKKLDGPATSAEAIITAGLDWKVAKTPLFVASGGHYARLEDRFATVRIGNQGNPETGSPFGVVGRSYVPLQNCDAFRWFDDIVGQKAAIYHTAGALGDGERVWILAKLPDVIRIVGDDIAEKYLLLSNSHDGTSSVQVKFTPIRVVCQNTLTMALSDGKSIRVQHSAALPNRLKMAQLNLGIIQSRFARIEQAFKRMQSLSITSARLARFLVSVFPDPKNEADESGAARVREARQAVTGLFETGRGNNLRGVSGTLWAAYNGVTEFVDYRLSARGTPDRRLESIWFGSGYLAKARAHRVAMDCVEEWRN